MFANARLREDRKHKTTGILSNDFLCTKKSQELKEKHQWRLLTLISVKLNQLKFTVLANFWYSYHFQQFFQSSLQYKCNIPLTQVIMPVGNLEITVLLFFFAKNRLLLSGRTDCYCFRKFSKMTD